MRRFAILHLPAVVVQLLLITACSLPPVDRAATRQSIIDGDLHPGHPAIGLLVYWPDGPPASHLNLSDPISSLPLASYSLCTATLVGMRTLLSAAHCVFDTEHLERYAFHVNSDIAHGDWGDRFTIEQIQAHPDYHNGLHDLSVVRLAQIPGIEPIRLGKAPEVGDEITLYGYGENPTLSEAAGQAKRVATNLVSQRGQWNYGFWGTSDGIGNICSGDSGGPSIVEREDVEIVVGVHSFVRNPYGGQAECGQLGVDARTDADIDWIKEAALGDVFTNGEIAPPPGEAPDDDLNFGEGTDRTPPTISVSLGRGISAECPDCVGIEVSASDNVAVDNIALWVNGHLFGPHRATSYTFSIPSDLGPRLEIRAVVADSSGNEKSLRINLTVPSSVDGDDPDSPTDEAGEPAGDPDEANDNPGSDTPGSDTPGADTAEPDETDLDPEVDRTPSDSSEDGPTDDQREPVRPDADTRAEPEALPTVWREDGAIGTRYPGTRASSPLDGDDRPAVEFTQIESKSGCSVGSPTSDRSLLWALLALALVRSRRSKATLAS